MCAYLRKSQSTNFQFPEKCSYQGWVRDAKFYRPHSQRFWCGVHNKGHDEEAAITKKLFEKDSRSKHQEFDDIWRHHWDDFAKDPLPDFWINAEKREAEEKDWKRLLQGMQQSFIAVCEGRNFRKNFVHYFGKVQEADDILPKTSFYIHHHHSVSFSKISLKFFDLKCSKILKLLIDFIE